MESRVDDLDLNIIKELQKNARKSYRDIADTLSVAEGTVYNRVNKLRDMGVIKRFIPDVDFSKLGYELTALVGVIVEGGHLIDIERKISKVENVSAVYDVTGDYDTIIVAKFKNRGELNRFVKGVRAMKYVKRTYTMFVLNTLKEVHGVEIK